MVESFSTRRLDHTTSQRSTRLRSVVTQALSLGGNVNRSMPARSAAVSSTLTSRSGPSCIMPNGVTGPGNVLPSPCVPTNGRTYEENDGRRAASDGRCAAGDGPRAADAGAGRPGARAADADPPIAAVVARTATI